MTIPVGDKAPDFTLSSSSGATITLTDLIADRSLVLFFYPKDETAGCTAEACAFRDQFAVFAEAGADVVGVSSDSVESHGHFASRHELPMKLLSDPGGKVRKLYGVRSTLGIVPGRATFVIDRSGIVRHVFVSQLRVTKHVDEALAVVRRLQVAR
jgi:thioredoxin-dependent peroxiredoxin